MRFWEGVLEFHNFPIILLLEGILYHLGIKSLSACHSKDLTPKMVIWRESSWSWEKIQFQFGETFLKGQFCQEFILLRVILPPEIPGVWECYHWRTWKCDQSTRGHVVHEKGWCWWWLLLMSLSWPWPLLCWFFVGDLLSYLEYVYINNYIYIFICSCISLWSTSHRLKKNPPDLLPWSWLRHQHLDQFLLYTGRATPVEPFMKFQGSRQM